MVGGDGLVVGKVGVVGIDLVEDLAFGNEGDAAVGHAGIDEGERSVFES